MLPTRLRVRSGWGEILRRTAVKVYNDDCLGLAAQLAYWFFLALFPTLLCLVALASFFPLEPLVPRLIEIAGPWLPEDIMQIVRDQLVKISEGQHGGLLTFGLLAALWSSSAAMTAIIDALNRAYHVQESRPWWKRRLVAIALTGGLAVFLLISVAVIATGPDLLGRLMPRLGIGVPLDWLGEGARWAIAFAIIAIGMGGVYYFGPDVDQDWLQLVPGSLLGAAAWLLASLGFKQYVVHFATYTETYGAIGGVIVLLLWLYLTGLAILVGAELNSEIAQTARGRHRPGKVIGGRTPAGT
jgi:membrane protein